MRRKQYQTWISSIRGFSFVQEKLSLAKTGKKTMIILTNVKTFF